MNLPKCKHHLAQSLLKTYGHWQHKMNCEHRLVIQAVSNTRIRIWRVCLLTHDINHIDRHKHGRHFVVKCGGTAWCETNIVIGLMQKWRFLYSIQIPNFTSRHVLRATIIMLCSVLADELHVNIHKFFAGHGTVVQPASINIVFGCKQAQQHSRTHHLGFYQSCQLECTKCWIALVARAYHSYSRTLQFSCIS